MFINFTKSFTLMIKVKLINSSFCKSKLFNNLTWDGEDGAGMDGEARMGGGELERWVRRPMVGEVVRSR